MKAELYEQFCFFILHSMYYYGTISFSNRKVFMIKSIGEGKPI